MELHEIRYFLTLSRTLNFSRAAELCNVSQPALTRAIQKMEEELGGLLFSRERGNTHLTDLGRLIEPHLAEVIARAEAARHTAQRFTSLEGAALTLGVVCTVAPRRFAGFLKQFRAEQPGIELTVVEAPLERLREMLVRGDLEVAVMAQPAPFEDPLRAAPLYAERFAVACPADHPFAAKNGVRMADLDGQPYLSRVNCEYQDYLSERLQEHGAKVCRCFRSEREDWVLALISSGMGVCFLPEFAAAPPGVTICPLVEPVVTREVCAVTVAGRRWSPPCAAFMQAVRRYTWNDPIPDADRSAMAAH